MNTEEGQQVEKILCAWKKAQRKKAGILQTFACSIALIASFACMPDGQWNIPALLLFSGIAVIACVIISRRLLSNGAFERHLQKMLTDQDFADPFRRSIDRELSRSLRTQFYDQQYRLQLYITENWFILISTNASIICRREDVKEVSRHLDRSTAEFYILLELADGGKWVCVCHRICQELLQCIREELFP